VIIQINVPIIAFKCKIIATAESDISSRMLYYKVIKALVTT